MAGVMFVSRTCSEASKWLNAIALAAAFVVPATAQNFEEDLAGSTISWSGLPGNVGTQYQVAGLPDVREQEEGFFYGISAQGSYNSNLFLDDGGEVDDFIFSVRPWVRYQTAPPGGATAVATVFYAPSIEKFVDNSGFDRLNHTASAGLQFSGARSQIGTTLGYYRASSSNRFAGTFVESETITGAINGSYEISPKTTVSASWGVSDSSYDQAGMADFRTYSAQLTGWWQATPLVRLGPSIRHSETESDLSGDREAWALLMRIAYELTGKLRVNLSGGAEWQELTAIAGGTRDGTQLTGALTANWAIDAAWSLAFGMSYRNTPSLSSTNYFINNFGVDLTATRELAKGSVRGGIVFEHADYEESGPVATPRTDEEFWSIFGNYQRPIFKDAMNFTSSVRFSENSGLEDWSNVQLSFGLNYLF